MTPISSSDLSRKALDLAFLTVVKDTGIPEPEREYPFASAKSGLLPPRKWRFDYAWIDERVALEVEGGVWTQGRHTRGSGFLRDVEKYNRATVLGWRVVRCTPQTLCDPATLEMLKDLLSPSGNSVFQWVKNPK